MALLFFIWFLLAIVVGVVANSMGRSAGLWFVLSMVITPFVTGVTLFFLALEEVDGNAESDYGRTSVNTNGKNLISHDKENGSVTIERPSFTDRSYLYARAAHSVNGEYAAAFLDHNLNGDGLSGGNRTDGKGAVLLIKGQEMVWSKRLERPVQGAVSNDGHVAVEDWLFGGGLKGVFYVFTPDGESVVRENFSANLIASGISADGQVAFCNTANSTTEDANVVAVYDVASGERLFKRDETWGRPETIVRNSGAICIQTQQGVVYEFSDSGEMLNPGAVEEAIIEAKIASGSTTELLDVVDSRIESPDVINADEEEELMRYLDEAESATKSENKIAKVYRKRGELCLRLGKKREALEHFHRALGLNERVGVKRKTEQLESELGT